MTELGKYFHKLYYFFVTNVLIASKIDLSICLFYTFGEHMFVLSVETEVKK